MSTKISRFADGLIEAIWLAAIVMTPLFFNKYSSRIFEPDKATLLRTLALIGLLAWAIKIIDQYLSGDKILNFASNFKTLLKTPIATPVAILGVVYIFATIFSVTPRISFWGSYQRLQGLYTTFAYLALFALIAGNLRRHDQAERLITTAILTSLPVSLYGILQHYGIDPIPWGGDVTRRVASHMGNPIFVSAFLILVFPLAVGRIVDSFKKILQETEGLGIQTARATVYIFIAALQLIAIFFTQSRGPWLGLFSGGFFLFVLLSLYWKKRWMTFSIITIAVLAGSFLIVLNIPDGPLQSLHSNNSFRRLGELLNTGSRTARVRSLIWGGASKMVSPHEPIEYPDGRLDIFNPIRPVIGYGPETMHMAYNPFYPPELAYVEARNASPDRSHNETWDSMVFTGLLGLLAYLSVFTSVFYYGLKWLGLISTPKKKVGFFVIYLGSGVISAVIFAFWQGIAFAGLGLPFGLILGLILYLGIIALVQRNNGTAGQENKSNITGSRSLTLIMLLAAVVSHFAEINFGISIVSTRTYFFAYAALILVVGYILPGDEESLLSGTLKGSTTLKKSKDRRERKSRKTRRNVAGLGREIAISGIIGGLLILPMNYEYISNLWGLTSTSKILWSSLTQVEENIVSYGVLALILTTWISSSVILASEVDVKWLKSNWWKTLGGILGVSGLFGIFYGFWLSGSLAGLARMAPQNLTDIITQTAGLESLLTQYYTFLIFGMLILGVFLPIKWPPGSRKDSTLTPFIGVLGFLLVIWLAVTTNLKVIHADIAFKMAEPFANSKQWAVANAIYRRAIDLSPDEDYYYLFLGRGSLEETKQITDPIEQEQAFISAESDLISAQKINPLNPDHTANLARLYSWWALQAPDEITRQERGMISDQYYAKVLVLSPNNARLWDEWAILHLNVLKDSNRAYEILSYSLEIDPNYDWTHALVGDYFSQKALKVETTEERVEIYNQAIYHYQQGIKYSPKSTNYYYALASAYQSIDNIEMVISTLEDSLEYASNNEIWKIEDNLTHYYVQLNDFHNALIHAKNALAAAPESEQERILTIINQLQSSP